MNFRISCKYCDTKFKSKEYLERHITSIHTNIDTFAQIRDCVDSEGDFSTTRSAPKEDNSVDPADTTDLDIMDFLDSLWSNDSSPVRSLPKQKTQTCTVSTSTMHTRTEISISTQTDIVDLPPIKKLKHTGCNTTPKIFRDRANQFDPTVTDTGVSPHCEFKDESPWPLSPEITSPRAPDCGIPRYFTTEYQQNRESLNLPKEVTFHYSLLLRTHSHIISAWIILNWVLSPRNLLTLVFLNIWKRCALALLPQEIVNYGNRHLIGKLTDRYVKLISLSYDFN